MSKIYPPVKSSEFIQKMYMQINNIAQGFAIAILIQALSERFMNGSHKPGIEDFYIFNLAFTSLLISIIFWTRYYFDTEVIKRSFSVKSVTWFFLYIVSEGFSFMQITEPVNWFISTGIFLFFGFGFYILNLTEIPRPVRKSKKMLNTKGHFFHKVGVWMRATYLYLFREKKGFREWQAERLIDMVALCALTFSGAWLVMNYPMLIYPVSVLTLLFAVWQLSKSRDYKNFGFLDKLKHSTVDLDD